MGFRELFFKIKDDKVGDGTWSKGGHARGGHATYEWAHGGMMGLSMG